MLAAGIAGRRRSGRRARSLRPGLEAPGLGRSGHAVGNAHARDRGADARLARRWMRQGWGEVGCL